MEAAAQPRRVLVIHAAPEAIAPRTRLLFHKLGYAIVDPDELTSLQSAGGCDRPDLRIVDERSLGEVPGLGTRLDVSFSLPRSGVLRLDAEIAYQLVPDLGIVFNGTSPGVRDAIRGFVQEALANR